MRIPSPSDFQEAFQNPSLSLLDPDLAAGEVRLNALGLPQPIAGAFAVVFSVDAAGGRFAARCFLTEPRDHEARYAAIGRFQKRNSLPFLADVEYQKKGIRIGEDVYPILKMAWVQGSPLNHYVASRLDRPEELASLARAWLALVLRMEDVGMAHGDLQHGNVLVQEGMDGEAILGLVDYDSMFVPELRGKQSREIGHRNYQHCERSSRHFDHRVDRFSALVIYLALRALEVRPDLWTRYDTGENLLFQADDFYRPGQSHLLSELRLVEPVAALAVALERACLIGPLEAPALGQATHEGAVPQSALAPGPKPVHATEGRRDPFEKAAVWMLPAILAFSYVVSIWNETLGLACFVGLFLVASGLFIHRLATHEVIIRRRRLAGEMGQIRRICSQLERELEMLETERHRLSARQAAIRQQRLEELQNQELQDLLRFRFISELEHVDGISHKSVVKLKRAGIRTALHVTRERLEGIQGLGPVSRGRILEWHDGIVAELLLRRVSTELPESESRRIDREIVRRRDELAQDADRMRQKVLIQSREQERVRARLNDLPAPSSVRYLAFLLRLSERNPLSTDPGAPAASGSLAPR